MQSNALEKQFGKYQQRLGGTYLITVQNIFQKFKIDKTRKLLGKQLDLTTFPPINHHVISVNLMWNLICQYVKIVRISCQMNANKGSYILQVLLPLNFQNYIQF